MSPSRRPAPRGRVLPPRPLARAPRSCPVAVGRDVPIAPPCPVVVSCCRTPLVSRRRALLPCAPPLPRCGLPPRCVAWQVAHAESFACRSSAEARCAAEPLTRSDARPPDLPARAAITPARCARALPGRRDRDIAPYRHYTREFRMVLSARCGAPPRRAPPPCLTLVSPRRAASPAPSRLAIRPWRLATRRHPVRQDSLSFNVSATAERTLSGDMECRQIPDFKPHERLWHGQHDGSPVACKTVCELP